MVKMLKNLHCFIFKDKPKQRVELKIEVYKIMICVSIINYNCNHVLFIFILEQGMVYKKENLEPEHKKGSTLPDAKQKATS